MCLQSLQLGFPYFRVVYFSIVKLAHDVLKELVGTNSCKYSIEVATHLKCTFIGQTLFAFKCIDAIQVIKIEELVKSYHSYQQGEVVIGFIV